MGAYSYHVFFLPFSWFDRNWDLNTIFGQEKDENIWENVDKSSIANNYQRTVLLDQVNKEEYDAFRFFNANVRNLFFSNEESGQVHNYRVKDKYLEELQYIIAKNEEMYCLDVNAIFLHVFSSGVAIIEMRCSNSLYRSLSAVKAINEYGRRLALSFWPQKGYSKVADYLELKGPNLKIKEDFASFKHNRVSYSYVSKLFRRLLDKNGSGVTFRAKTTFAQNEIQIRTLIDEKMYDCCLIVDGSYLRELYESYKSGDECFAREEGINLWELISVEPAGSCNQKNYKMISKHLEESLFLEDFNGERPKLTAVTDQAIIKLLAEEDYEIEFFNNVYTRIALLVLAQRISIAKFTTDIHTWNIEIGQKHKRITMEKIKKVMQLQEAFIAFRNQYMMSEVTVKCEGKFLYKKLQEDLDIANTLEDLAGQISSLYELVHTAQGETFSKWGLAVSLIALEFSLAGLINITNDIGKLKQGTYYGTGALLFVGAVAAIIIWVVFGIIYRRKDK